MIIEKITNYVEERNVLYRDIAKEANIPAKSLSQFISNNAEIDILFVVRLVKLLFPNEEYALMTEYIKVLKRPENIRNALEYASYHELNDLLEYLVNKELESKTPINREWAKSYQIDLMFKKGEIDTETLRNKSREIRVNSNEMKIVQEYCETKSLYIEKNYNFLLILIKNIQSRIKAIKDSLFKVYFISRINLVLTHAYLYLGDEERSQMYAYKFIKDNLDLRKIGHIYHTIGLSYLYYNFAKSNDYLRKAKYIFLKLEDKNEVKNINNSIAFVNNYWSKSFDIIDDIDKTEIIHYYIRNNQNNKAKLELEKIDESVLNPSRKAFLYYYKGLSYNSNEFFYKSIKEFNEIGNKFYGKLAALELKKRGESEYILEAVYGRKI